jgi:hypothetical protein
MTFPIGWILRARLMAEMHDRVVGPALAPLAFADRARAGRSKMAQAPQPRLLAASPCQNSTGRGEFGWTDGYPELSVRTVKIRLEEGPC